MPESTAVKIDVPALVKGYRLMEPSLGAEHARRWLVRQLAPGGENAFGECASQLLGEGQADLAIEILGAAVAEFPVRRELRFLLCMTRRQLGDIVRAEAGFRELLAADPAYRDAAFGLAGMLRDSGRIEAACSVIRQLADHAVDDLEACLQCAVFLNQSQRAAASAAVCEKAIAGGFNHPRLQYLSGALALSLGQFDAARQRMEAALEAGSDLNNWFVLQALADAQRYDSPTHPDFALFERHLADPKLRDRGRASALFALGKASDDIGDHARAVRCWSEANRIVRSETSWSAEAWRRFVADRTATPFDGLGIAPVEDFVPVFIVGMPRSGTTLVAGLLARHEAVRNRGELNWIDFIASRLAQHSATRERVALHEGARLYYSHVRQDDAPARWYIDKNALNFRHLGLIATLFPNARIVYCRRDPLDTALSIWGHFFAKGQNEFAYDLGDIAAVAEGCNRLMAHWAASLPLPIHLLDYEKLATEPAATLAALTRFVGLPADFDPLRATSRPEEAIGTSSLWQARQPLYQTAIGRAQNYATHLPELRAAFYR